MMSAEMWQTVQLRKVDDGWKARDENTETVAEGATREAAVESLREAVERRAERGDTEPPSDGTSSPDVSVSGADAWKPAQ